MSRTTSIDPVTSTVFNRPTRFYTESFSNGRARVNLQFQHGWGRFKWWRTYFVAEVIFPNTVTTVKARVLKNALEVV